jgi:hypothetical protein
MASPDRGDGKIAGFEVLPWFSVLQAFADVQNSSDDRPSNRLSLIRHDNPKLCGGLDEEEFLEGTENPDRICKQREVGFLFYYDRAGVELTFA